MHKEIPELKHDTNGTPYIHCKFCQIRINMVLGYTRRATEHFCNNRCRAAYWERKLLWQVSKPKGANAAEGVTLKVIEALEELKGIKNKEEKQCKYCNAPYTPKRKWQNFCSIPCRTHHYWATHEVVLKVETKKEEEEKLR